MRRSTGAIFRDTRPETIITSACRGLARKTSAPNRARSLRDEVAFIISMAQHARPNVAGQSDDLRAQLMMESRRVVNTSGRASPIIFSSPIKNLCSSASSCALTSPVFVSQQFCFSFSFDARSLAPIQRPLLDHVNQSSCQQSDEEHHLGIYKISEPVHWSSERLKHYCPRHQEYNFY